MFEYKFLKALAMVVREQGFDKAARAMHLTQSAVSQRIKALEEQVGQILLVRSAPPVPTSAGQRMIKHYLQIRLLEDDLHTSLSPDSSQAYTRLAVGLNADSLALWFFDAVTPFLQTERVLVDLRVDDQDETLRMLKNGEVVGCISSREKAVQGCQVRFLGSMDYRFLAAPAFVKKWFPHGFDLSGAGRAPSVVFNRKDDLNAKLYRIVFHALPSNPRLHYVPSTERFVDFISSGLGYGVLPDSQAKALVSDGHLVDLAPGAFVRVALYWHCWNLASTRLARFTDTLVHRSRLLLKNN